MFEIAISPRSQRLVPTTRYDVAVGFQFEQRFRAEAFCQELNTFCYQDRFVVVRAGLTAERLAALPKQTLKAAA